MALRIVKESEPIKVERIEMCASMADQGEARPSARETWLGLRSVLCTDLGPLWGTMLEEELNLSVYRLTTTAAVICGSSIPV